MFKNDSQTDRIKNERLFRDVLGHYPTGIAFVAGVVDGQPVGMVVGSFASVSMDPPLVSFMPQKSSETYATLRKADSFCISVLAHDQMSPTRTLASRDPEKFDNVSWSTSAHGAPQLDDAIALIHGTLFDELEAGDHWITLIEVQNLEVIRPVAPLLFFQGGYGGFSTTGLSAHVDNSLLSAARVAEVARPELERLGNLFNCSAAAIVQISPVDQMIGAIHYGDGNYSDERVGVRIPLVPPIGEAMVAWDPEQIDKWSQRIYPLDADTIARHSETAERVRAQGYAITRSKSDDQEYQDLLAALDEYALSELTPARERAVKSVIAASSKFYGGSLATHADSDDISSVTVTVRDPTSETPRGSGLVIRLSSYPASVSSETAHEWVTELKRSAEIVRQELQNAAQVEYARYAASGLR